jgi:lipoprotein-releasing system permease protein
MYLEKIAMFVALSFVVLVSAFGILTSNLMSVLERYEEIAIMKAMGASDRSIQLIFWAEGLCVGVLGGASGIGIGLLICWALARFGLPFEAIYYMHEVPVEVHWDEVGLVGVSVLVVVWLFTLYPARIAARMRPVDTLRLAD